MLRLVLGAELQQHRRIEIRAREVLHLAPHLVHAYYPASGQVFYERLRHASIYYDVGRWEAHPITDDTSAQKHRCGRSPQ